MATKQSAWLYYTRHYSHDIRWVRFSQKNWEKLEQTWSSLPWRDVVIDIEDRGEFNVDISSQQQTEVADPKNSERIMRQVTDEVGGSFTVWQWRNHNGEWVAYSLQSCVLIERALTQCKESAQFLLAELEYEERPYIIDFGRMQQIRQSTRFQRDVRRIPPLPLPFPAPEFNFQGYLEKNGVYNPLSYLVPSYFGWKTRYFWKQGNTLHYAPTCGQTAFGSIDLTTVVKVEDYGPNSFTISTPSRTYYLRSLLSSPESANRWKAEILEFHKTNKLINPTNEAAQGKLDLSRNENENHNFFQNNNTSSNNNDDKNDNNNKNYNYNSDKYNQNDNNLAVNYGFTNYTDTNKEAEMNLRGNLDDEILRTLRSEPVTPFDFESMDKIIPPPQSISSNQPEKKNTGNEYHKNRENNNLNNNNNDRNPNSDVENIDQTNNKTGTLRFEVPTANKPLLLNTALRATANNTVSLNSMLRTSSSDANSSFYTAHSHFSEEFGRVSFASTGVFEPPKREENSQLEMFYKKGPLLGHGAFGEVHAYTSLENGATVAVKKISNMNRTQVKREIDIMSKLCHKHIVQFIEAFESADAWWVVMECVPGGELLRVIDYRMNRNLPFTELEVAQMSYQLLKALEYTHSRGITHRDLKPQNILVVGTDPNQQPLYLKISDWGLAREDSNNCHSIIGTPIFMAPEVACNQWQKKSYDGTAADIWSLGCIIYILFSGSPPFLAHDDPKERLINKMHGLNFKSDAWTPVSCEAISMISKMLDLTPMNRPSAGECLSLSFFRQSEQNMKSSTIQFQMHPSLLKSKEQLP